MIVGLQLTTAQNSIQLKFNKDKRFKIAQFTDIHWDNNSENCSKTIKTIEYVLNTEKPDLTLESVILTIEGNHTFSGCGLGLKHCDEDCQCPIHESFSPIRDAIKKLVAEETIQGLTRKKATVPEMVLNRI